MDWQKGDSPDKHIQFIPAEKGWLALVREGQLDPNFVDENNCVASHSREDTLHQAEKNHADRLQGHETWRRQHRTERSEKAAIVPIRIF
jgi:hypothetical protein